MELELLGGAGGPHSDLEDPRLLDHALYVLSPRLAAAPKTVVNVRIVIVGASDAALAAASTLVLQSSVTLRSLVLVAPGGPPAPHDYFSSPAPFTSGREFAAWELARLPIASHARVVDDTVTGIQRKERSISLASGAEVRTRLTQGGGGGPRDPVDFPPPLPPPSPPQLPYDFLLLLPGLTEPTWARLGHAARENMPRGQHCLTHASAALEEELQEDASLVAQALQSAGAPADVPVVVYGDSLDALTTVNALLDRGIAGGNIVLVQVRPGAEKRLPECELEHPPPSPPTARTLLWP